jgi:hypothetical protein
MAYLATSVMQPLHVDVSNIKISLHGHKTRISNQNAIWEKEIMGKFFMF